MWEVPRTSDNPMYKWLVTIAVMCGSFMVVLDTTVVNVALPKIMASFGVNINTILWVITAYLLAMAVMMPSVGWLSQRIGHKRVFIASLLLFTLASCLCGFAWSESALIAFRVLQGLGAGLLMPMAMVIIFEAFPLEQRGLAMGIYGIGATFGPAIGPTLGGFLTEKFSWHFIFFINIPVGLLGLFLATAILPRGTPQKGLHFDLWGFLSMTVTLGCLLLGLSQGQRDGWTSAPIVGLFLAALLALAVFFRVESRAANPFIDLGVYKSFSYSMATAIFVIQGIGLFGATFLIPLFFETVLDYSALEAGYILVPMALVVSMVLPLAGRLADRTDARVPIGLGVLFSVISLYWLSFLSLQTTALTGVGMLIMRGLGIGFIFPPIMKQALNSLPQEKVATGSGLMNVSRQVGGAFGVALLGTLLERRELFHRSLPLYAQHLSSPAVGSLAQHKDLWSIHTLSSFDAASAHNALAAAHVLTPKSAMAASFDDCFFVAACVFALAFIPTILLRKRSGAPAA